MILSGDRWAATVRVDLAAEQYDAAWVSAFGALTPLVVTPATNVPPATLGAAAENALASHRIEGPSSSPIPGMQGEGMPGIENTY